MRTLISLTILAAPLGAQFAKVGQAGAKFLSISLSPRGVGMGETFASVVDDASAPFWNPAGLSNLNHRSLFTVVAPWWVPNTQVFGISYAVPVKGGFFGAFASGLNSSNFQEWILDANGDITKGGTFGYLASQLGVSYARYLTDKFSIGLNAKGIYEGYGPYSSTWTAAADLGSFYRTGFRDLTLAMAIQNFGPDMKPSGQFARYTYSGGSIAVDSAAYSPYPLPLLFRVGLSMSLLSTPLYSVFLASEVTHPNDNEETYAIGTELALVQTLFVRGGYKANTDEGGLSLGFGINLFKVKFDYSFSDNGRLPDIHRFGVELNL